MGARQRRDNLRRTWVPTGKDLRRLEEERGIVIRFVIGYRSAMHSHIICHWTTTGFAALQAQNCIACMLASDGHVCYLHHRGCQMQQQLSPENFLTQTTSWFWLVGGPRQGRCSNALLSFHLVICAQAVASLLQQAKCCKL